MDAGQSQGWERLIDERGIAIDRPRWQAHPLYPDMIYPCDYGHVPGTTAADGEEGRLNARRGGRVPPRAMTTSLSGPASS
jgi:hypothetical protein